MNIINFFSKQQSSEYIKEGYAEFFLSKGMHFPDDFLTFHIEYDVSSYKPNSKIAQINAAQNEFECKLGFKMNEPIFKMDNYYYLMDNLLTFDELSYVEGRQDLVKIGHYGYHTHIGCADDNLGKIFYYEEGPFPDLPYEEYNYFIQIADSFTEFLSKLRLIGFDENTVSCEIDFDGENIIYKT